MAAPPTGASEPRNMIYMSRLGIWGEGTPFRNFEEFLQAVEKRGVGAMEIVAMDMKVSGMYIARQLSFSGVTFRIEEIPLTPAFERVYNRAALLVSLGARPGGPPRSHSSGAPCHVSLQWAEALNVFQQAADWIGLESRKSLWGQFWSAHQRFFKYLCIAAKVRRLVELAREELARDKGGRACSRGGAAVLLGPSWPLSRCWRETPDVHLASKPPRVVTTQRTAHRSSPMEAPRQGWWLTALCCPPQCVVIGLQSTGEARTREVLGENDGHLNCFVSAAE
ncbi:Protein strawberry notch 2 [Saguinus oedipus]|uniref:Protein strawberry notch 2 n=1 Tax=Saguinus oedipus TaxID=9490 RepID=A0ABQ9TPY3_SAGOE|nr:Protein strawberry notch 2 [Saguinus oedipus]